MNYSFYFIVIFLIFTIVFVTYMDLIGIHLFSVDKEGLTNKPEFVFIGDSMLDNSSYIDNNMSVPDLMKEKGANLINYAKDGATIHACYSQINSLVSVSNGSCPENSVFVVSAGGNDIINENRNNAITESFIQSLFTQYSAMVLTIRKKCPQSPIYLLNLYKPVKPKFEKLYPFIDQWNSLIDEFAKNNNFKVIPTNKLLTLDTDFVYEYEPSKTGGQKIVDAIYHSVSVSL
jgi:lysophospholipase L1-like esterase